MNDPTMAFVVDRHDAPSLEVRVNFGVFAGREATPAEIDELAGRVSHEVDEFSIVAEQRHEFGHAVEAALHQVRLEIAPDAAPRDVGALCDRLVAVAETWAEACIAERHAEISEL